MWRIEERFEYQGRAPTQMLASDGTVVGKTNDLQVGW